MREDCEAEHPACAALAVLRELREARREKMEILSAAYEREHRGQKYERELARNVDAMRRVVEAAVAWWRAHSPCALNSRSAATRDLARAVAEYVAARTQKEGGRGTMEEA